MVTASFPNEPFASGSFDLEDYMQIVRTRGGATHAHERAPRRWRGRWETRNLSRTEVQPWKSWKNKQRGGLIYFFGFDPERRYPSLYKTGFAGLTRHVGGAAFDGTGNIDAVTAYGFTMSSLPPTFAFKAGDLIGLIEDGYYAIHEVQSDATASAGVVTVVVEPEIKTTLFSAAATFNLAKPVCTMILEEYSAPRNPEGGIISFSGLQVWDDTSV